MSDFRSTGERIALTRKRLKLTQQELADKIGYKRGTLAGIETDKDEPGIKMLIAIADVFGVPLDWLLGRVVPSGAPLAAEVANTPSEVQLLRFWRTITLRQRNKVVTLLEREVSVRAAQGSGLGKDGGKKSRP